jgi:hypothetical protein
MIPTTFVEELMKGDEDGEESWGTKDLGKT